MSGSCSVIIPTYNEEDNIVNMAKAIRKLYPDFYIFFMDDNSTDHSKKLIEELGDIKTKLIVRDANQRGLAASCFQGIIECNSDYFIVMDCDFQHPPSALGDTYIKLEEGYDLVVGTRTGRFALGPKRWIGSWAFNIMADLYLFKNRKSTTLDVMSGLYAGRCDTFVPIIKNNWENLEMEGWKVLIDLLKFSPNNLKIATIKYEFRKRALGRSHINHKVVITTFRQMGKLGKFFATIYDKLVC